MTASERAEAWREVAESVDTPGNRLGLCHGALRTGLYDRDEAYGTDTYDALHFWFKPSTQEAYWWPLDEDGHQERATAACFLAAMEDEGYE